MSWRKFLVIPQLIYYGIRSPHSQSAAWDRYWAAIDKTGPGGQVLWDAADRAEFAPVLERLRQHTNISLPIVDVGCGNGRQCRELAAQGATVLGLDASEHAIGRAKKESQDVAGLSFRVADITAPGLGAGIQAELGDTNVYIRGVLHVLDNPGRIAAVENLRTMLGQRGTLYLSETNIESPLDHLEFQGATATGMPDPLRRCIAAGIRPPAHFGAQEVATYFPKERWDTLLAGPEVMRGVPLHAGRTLEDIPSYFAIVKPRS